jgi:hypothetical protein
MFLRVGAQADPQTQAVKKLFAGRKMLITYREGSPLRGTYFFLQVRFCESGTFWSLGESHKHRVSRGTEVRHWRDEGTWAVATESGPIGVRCLFSSGQATFFPTRFWPSRDGGTTSGISVLPQRGAQCQ